MGQRGVLFALTAAQLATISSLPTGDDDALTAFVENVESAWDEDGLVETDKAWDAIHRCLTDGKLEWGDTPFHRCILGEKNLHTGDEYLVNLVTPADVRGVAAVMAPIDEAALRLRYERIDITTYHDAPEGDFDYTWDYFRAVKAFYQKAAASGHAVLFTVDQ